MGRSRESKQVPSYGHHAHVSILVPSTCNKAMSCFIAHHPPMLKRSSTFAPVEREIFRPIHRACVGQCAYSSCQHGASLPSKRRRRCLSFYFLPPYSPHLNPIERLWKWLKDEVIANICIKIKTILPSRLLGLNNMSYSIQMRCYAASGVLRKPGVKMSIWMYIDY